MKKIALLLVIVFLPGCIYTVNKSSTLEEPPFTTIFVKGSPTEAAACVGKYWQSEIKRNLGDLWQVWTYPYQVEVAGPTFGGPGAPIVGLVVEFEDKDGKTIALAHCHRAFSDDMPQRTVTLKALEACKAN